MNHKNDTSFFGGSKVMKPLNEWRSCGSYEKLHSRIILDRYPIPHIEDFAQSLHGKTIFSTVDLVRAYNQIPVAEEDIPKTAITTPLIYAFQQNSSKRSPRQYISLQLRT